MLFLIWVLKLNPASRDLEKNNQRGRKKYIACKINFFTFFLGLWSRGNSREFFLIHFPSLMDFNGKINCQIFCGDFHFDIWLIVLMICQTNICQFFGGDRS